MPDEEPERGRKPRVTDDELIAAIEGALADTGAPVVRTAAIEDCVPIGRRAVTKRLDRLAEDPESPVEVLDASGRARVWWLAENGEGENEP